MSEPNGGRFDLAALAQKSEPSTIRPAAASTGEGNPFLDQVVSSYEQDETTRDSGWREVKVPRSMLDELITSMRALSTYFGKAQRPIGVHLRIEYQNTADEDSWVEVGPGQFAGINRKDDRPVFFKYTGRKRMNRGRRTQQPTAAPQNPNGPQPTETAEQEDTELLPA
jgi:hypothetical protein